MVVGAILFSSIQLLPQLEQTDFRYTAMLAGLSLMPGGLVMMALMLVAAQAANHIQPRYLMAFGMLLIAMAMWHSTSLPPDASFDYFVWSRIYQTVGLPFLFIPITIASYAELPANRTNQASALINVARYLGGTIGISMANTLLQRREQFHQLRLTENLSQSSLAYQQALQSAADDLVARGAPSADAQHQAAGVLEQLVQQQGSLISYIDVFATFAIVAAGMAVVALLLVRNVRLSGGVVRR
jgi:DHA2 family multidrug resistance protein